MTFAGPVEATSTGRSSLDRRAGRAGFFAAAGVLAALSAHADQLAHALTYQPLVDALAELGGISAVIWFAMFAVLKIGVEGRSDRISGLDAFVLLAVVTLSLTPISIAPRVSLLLAGFYLLLTSRRHSDSWRVSLIIVALGGTLVWGRVLLTLFAHPILSLDAHIVASAIGSAANGNAVRFAGGNDLLIIAGPCSSVHNISIALVLWTTAAVLFRLRLDRGYLAIGLATVAWMFAVNIARLSMLGLHREQFDYFHAGAGASMFAWAGLLGAALLVGMGVVRAAERQQ